MTQDPALNLKSLPNDIAFMLISVAEMPPNSLF